MNKIKIIIFALVLCFISNDANARKKKNRKPKISNATLLEPNELLRTKHDDLSWGTPTCIDYIVDAVIEYHNTNPSAPKVNIGDLSLKNGGKFGHHLSHQTGNDVDVGYVHKGSIADKKKFTRVSRRNLDVEKTWDLLQSFFLMGDVQYIFIDFYVQKLLYKHALSEGHSKEELLNIFQYPRKSKSKNVPIRTSYGHDDHFHVRFFPASKLETLPSL